MVRKNSRPNPLARLSDAEIGQIVAQLRAALADLRPEAGTVDPADMPAWLRDDADDHQAAAGDRAGSRYAKHVRFQRGEMVVMNSARRAATDAAWERLTKTARQIQGGHPGGSIR